MAWCWISRCLSRSLMILYIIMALAAVLLLLKIQRHWWLSWSPARHIWQLSTGSSQDWQHLLMGIPDWLCTQSWVGPGLCSSWCEPWWGSLYTKALILFAFTDDTWMFQCRSFVRSTPRYFALPKWICTAQMNLQGLATKCVADNGWLLFLGNGKYVALVSTQVHLPFSLLLKVI